MKLLASAGQKVITCTLMEEPWGGQTYDAYKPMVVWMQTDCDDGISYSFDFSIFDRWVTHCLSCGLGPWIHCYSMLPWASEASLGERVVREPSLYNLLDGRTGACKQVAARAGDSNYVALWSAFLPALRAHLKSKGWLGHTLIAVDERPPAELEVVFDQLAKHAPEIKVHLAGSNKPELSSRIFDWAVGLDVDPPLADATIAARSSTRPDTGITTFYVCCTGLVGPNTFLHSPPMEAAWLSWHALARGYDGVLRWAYDSWPSDPIKDGRHAPFPAGDCFLVYPSACSSIRWEQLLRGIRGVEKVRIIRDQWDKVQPGAREELDHCLKMFCVYSKKDGARDVELAIDKIEAWLAAVELI